MTGGSPVTGDSRHACGDILVRTTAGRKHVLFDPITEQMKQKKAARTLKIFCSGRSCALAMEKVPTSIQNKFDAGFKCV